MRHSSCAVQIGRSLLKFETGKIARHASGSVVLYAGDTVVFASACRSPCEQVNDFIALRVDYTERFSAAGKTLGGFIKREGKASEREVLVSRLIDRPIRPLFPKGYSEEVQLLTYVWSYDQNHLPDILAINAASAALLLSDIPWVKPIGAVRVGRCQGEWVLNPTLAESQTSDLDLVLAGTNDGILMIEGACNFLKEEELLDALTIGHEAIIKICDALTRWQAEVGKQKLTPPTLAVTTKLLEQLHEKFGEPCYQALRHKGKQAREHALAELETTIQAYYAHDPDSPDLQTLRRSSEQLRSDIMRRMILEEGYRLDGRAHDEVRPIAIETSLLPRTHGSALFTRGETQALAVCTLGGETMGQRFEDLNSEGYHRFYLQYSFPPFSVGEVGRSGPPGRREVGHGKLAERALLPVVPPQETFGYTIRLESNITESNGSSSMASVCGGCLAMMDAGVPIKRPVAGIAMGLILEQDRYAILTDILGAEDALGDMDFKVAGDHEGITAFQMDIKVEGISLEVMRAALSAAKKGRIHILEKMLSACPQAKEALSPYAPRMVNLKIKPSQIGLVIGPGGKQIRQIIELCGPGLTVDLNDEGVVSICGANVDGVEAAVKMVKALTTEIEVGQVYDGKIKEILPFGVIVELLPGKEGLCHVSEMDVQRVAQPSDLVQVGDTFTVKVTETNERGQIRLSRRKILDQSSPPQLPAVDLDQVYEGTVKEILPFGVIIEVIEGRSGLCHISEMDHKRIGHPSDIARVGDLMKVKIIEINERGQLRLSRKQTLEKTPSIVPPSTLLRASSDQQPAEGG